MCFGGVFRACWWNGYGSEEGGRKHDSWDLVWTPSEWEQWGQMGGEGGLQAASPHSRVWWLAIRLVWLVGPWC